MSKIIRDIESIMKLAERVHEELNKGKITKARREVKGIIDFDLDELRRLKREYGDKRLLDECVIVLSDAKKALRDLDSFGLFSEAKELMDKIIQIERYELLECEEIEETKNKAYDFWYNNMRNMVIYHGTSSMYLEQIKKFGMGPSTKPFDEKDIYAINVILEKVQNLLFSGKIPRRLDGMPLTFTDQYITRYIKGGYSIYLTLNYEQAINYAIKQSEGGGEILRLLTEKIGYIFEIGQPILQYLTKSEIQKLEYFHKLMNFKRKKNRPVVLHILCICPAIFHTLPRWIKNLIKSFKKFWRYLIEVKEFNPNNPTVKQFRDFFRSKGLNKEYLDGIEICKIIKKSLELYQPDKEGIFVRGAIDHKYIINYEFV